MPLRLPSIGSPVKDLLKDASAEKLLTDVERTDLPRSQSALRFGERQDRGGFVEKFRLDRDGVATVSRLRQ